jgi:hypothetical protein
LLRVPASNAGNARGVPITKQVGRRMEAAHVFGNGARFICSNWIRRE